MMMHYVDILLGFHPSYGSSSGLGAMLHSCSGKSTRFMTFMAGDFRPLSAASLGESISSHDAALMLTSASLPATPLWLASLHATSSVFVQIRKYWISPMWYVTRTEYF
jgi:hypothetical protein